MDLPKKIKSSFLPRVAIPAVLVFAILLVIIFFQYTVDDAYITFRHSFNLLHFGELSWNLEGPREEAFSNPLYMFLGMIGIKLGIRPELPIKIFGLSVLILWLLRLRSVCTPKSNSKKKIALILFVICIPAYIHAFSGLETIFFSYLLFEYLASDSLGKSYDILLAVLMLWCRSEGVIFVAISIAMLFWNLFNNLNCFPQRRRSDQLILVLLPLVSISCLVFYAYKINYFGDIYPNTYYAKSGVEFRMGHVINNLVSSSPWLALLAVFTKWDSFWRRNTIKYIGILAIYLVYLKSELLMNYASRFWFQLLWPCVLSSFALNNNITSIKNLFISSSKSSAPSFLGITGLIALIIGINPNRSEFTLLAAYQGRLLRSHANLGVYINKMTDPKSSIYLGDVGILPYYAKRLTYDAWGLGTKSIGKNGVSYGMLNKFKPDIFLLQANNCTHSGTWEYKFPEELRYIKNNGYEFVHGFPWTSNYCMNLYVRKKLLPEFDNDSFSHIKDISSVNNRPAKAGFVDDILSSYKYLFKIPEKKLNSGGFEGWR